jgi:hypothetical protein
MAKRKKGSNSGQRSRRGNGSRPRKPVEREVVTPEVHGPTEPPAPLPAGAESLGMPTGFLSPRSLNNAPAEPAPAAPAAPTRGTNRGPRSRPGRGSMLSMSEVYEALAAILVPYALQFEAEMHPRVGYCLKTKHGDKSVKELNFAGVQLHQDHVSFHLFLLYSYPDLETALSPELRQRLQGKTSFQIELGADPKLFTELEDLTRQCFERFQAGGLWGSVET